MLCHVAIPQVGKASDASSYPFSKIVQSGLSGAVQRYNNHETEIQEWFDEDFGLSKRRREAEALRLQQLQIEQEIEQLQAQQEQTPFFYIREIPNKPPPPYTPPTPTQKPRPPVLSSEDQITQLVKSYSRTIFRNQNGGKEPFPKDAELEEPHNRLLWDISNELVTQMCCQPFRPSKALPWEKVTPALSSWRGSLRAKTESEVENEVAKEALVLFGLRPRVAQESLLVRWSRKKRDHVDEILVGESQAEEAEWTRYDNETVQVKNELTSCLLDSLIQETASAFSDIITRKSRRDVS